MSTYTDASLIVTPNAKKAGKLYALKGADLDVVRATTATYVGSDGLIKTALANEVRFDYTNGSCPSILVEPQRTNLVFPSDMATTQSRTVTAVSHTLSFYGTGSVTLSGVATGTLVGTGVNNRVTLTFTPTAGSLTLTVTGSVTNWQLEAGATATSYIPTVASTVTRNADVISKSGISNLIGQTQGTIFIDFDWSGNLTSASRLFQINNGTISSDIFLNITSINGNCQLFINNVGLPNFFLPNISVIKKFILVYTSNSLKMFVNGSLVFDSIQPISFAFLDRLNIGSSNIASERVANMRVNNFMIFKTALTDEQCIALTTL